MMHGQFGSSGKGSTVRDFMSPQHSEVDIWEEAAGPSATAKGSFQPAAFPDVWEVLAPQKTRMKNAEPAELVSSWEMPSWWVPVGLENGLRAL